MLAISVYAALLHAIAAAESRQARTPAARCARHAREDPERDSRAPRRVSQWTLWLRDIASGEASALVSVLATEGSAPRGAGTRMLVTADALHGTIGGGALEFRAIEQARAILAHPPGSWRVQDYPLGPLLGQCCGGRVRLLVEHVDPAALGWLREVADATPRSALVTELGPDCVTRRIAADDPAGRHVRPRRTAR